MSHIKTAYDLGVQKALKEAGYSSMDDVRKQAEALGLIQPEKTAAANPLDGLMAAVSKK